MCCGWEALVTTPVRNDGEKTDTPSDRAFGFFTAGFCGTRAKKTASHGQHFGFLCCNFIGRCCLCACLTAPLVARSPGAVVPT